MFWVTTGTARALLCMADAEFRIFMNIKRTTTACFVCARRRETDRQTDRQTERRTDTETEKEEGTEKERKLKHTDRQTQTQPETEIRARLTWPERATEA